MIEYIYNKGIKLAKSKKDNLYTTLIDWLILGQQSGFRRKEWAQDRSYAKKHKVIQRNVDGSPSAFIITDMEFRDKHNKWLDKNFTKDVLRPCIVNLKWR